jgi:hypothetical protein
VWHRSGAGVVDAEDEDAVVGGVDEADDAEERGADDAELDGDEATADDVASLTEARMEQPHRASTPTRSAAVLIRRDRMTITVGTCDPARGPARPPIRDNSCRFRHGDRCRARRLRDLNPGWGLTQTALAVRRHRPD